MKATGRAGGSSIGPASGSVTLRAAVEARLPEGLGVGITESCTIRVESMRRFDRTWGPAQ